MYSQMLCCRDCDATYPLDDIYACERCAGILEVAYSDALLRKEHIEKPDNALNGMWKYNAMLPVKNKHNIVTIGEGNTPLLKDIRIPDAWRMDTDFYIKAEMLNPSGSFKDRPSSVGVSIAKEHGHKAVVVASSGNASASASAYAARAGMDCIVFIPKDTDPGKVTQAQSYGAKVFRVHGGFSDAYKIALECSKKFKFPNVTSTFLNPYTVEGNKTVAYEIWEQLGRVPDYIIVPIGTGPLLVGIYRGFTELASMGLTGKMPKMIGAQSEQCMPIVKAYESGADTVLPWDKEIHTAAAGIADPLNGYERDGALTLKVVRQSGGSMVALNEREILEATMAIEHKVGLYSEPTGAISVGAVKKLYGSSMIKPGATVVSLVTGHGFKHTKRTLPIPELISHIDDILNKL